MLTDAVKVSIHRIVDARRVFLVEVYKSQYMSRNRMHILVSLAVPGIIFIGSSESDTGTSCKVPMAKEYKVIETAKWDENNESEESASILNTMLISPDFLQGDKGSESVFSFAPGEGSRPLRIFKDNYCEEFAYPGIYCGKEELKIVKEKYLCMTEGLVCALKSYFSK